MPIFVGHIGIFFFATGVQSSRVPGGTGFILSLPFYFIVIRIIVVYIRIRLAGFMRSAWAGKSLLGSRRFSSHRCGLYPYPRDWSPWKS